ncbi:MAG: NUDIX domain-containing protein [Bacillota bacterium]|nr:NUDIX domain-containing protein [Bacillota bacterium]
MLITTLCYIEQKGHVLLLHRTKKSHDINEGKWIGVGGKFRDRESPEDCLLREVREETGYRLTSWCFRGFVTFLQEGTETEYMCLYTADDFLVPAADAAGAGIPVRTHPAFAGPAGKWPVPDCSEGELSWISWEQADALSLWEGDRIFLRLLREAHPFFSLKLCYCNDRLTQAVLDGAPLALSE